jgi:hypothetical protein
VNMSTNRSVDLKLSSDADISVVYLPLSETMVASVSSTSTSIQQHHSDVTNVS